MSEYPIPPIKLEKIPEGFDPQTAPTYIFVTVVEVGKPSTERAERCSCGLHRNEYYVHGIGNHYVRSQDYDALLLMYARLEAQNQALCEALELCDIESQVANGHIGTPAYEKIRAAITQAKEQG